MEKVNYEADPSKTLAPLNTEFWTSHTHLHCHHWVKIAGFDSCLTHHWACPLPKKAKTKDWLLSAMVDLKKLGVTFSCVPNSLWATLALDAVQFTATCETPFSKKQTKKKPLWSSRFYYSMVLMCPTQCLPLAFSFKMFLSLHSNLLIEVYNVNNFCSKKYPITLYLYHFEMTAG